MNQKLNKEFYVYNKNNDKFVPVDAEPVPIDNYLDFDFFVHIDIDGKGCYNVSEGISGATVSRYCDTRQVAITQAKATLSTKKKSEILSLIKDYVKEHGISPRYLSAVLPC